MNEGVLYIVATPIGNLGDITLRALETLKKVDVIACEDTRNTMHLLTHFGISKRLIACHDHNEEARSTEIASLLRNGHSVALVSDSGMPLVSDPGYRIVRKITAEGLKLDVIPGPSAFVAGLVLSGMPVDKIVFLGFLPQKQSKKIRYLEEIGNFSGTVILYESPYRLIKTLDFLNENVETDRVSVVKEITKLHQKSVSGTMSEVKEKIGSDKVRGEYVIYFTIKNKND
jgi:16S rRNA (cytidine1402-2'-O)-methyltransferase